MRPVLTFCFLCGKKLTTWDKSPRNTGVEFLRIYFILGGKQKGGAKEILMTWTKSFLKQYPFLEVKDFGPRYALKVAPLAM